MAAFAFSPAVARSWQRRAGALAVAAAVACASTPATAVAAPDQAEIERLYIEGQQHAEKKDFRGAAESWTRLLNLLEESGDNQEIRESVIINVLESHLAAYNQLVDAQGNKDIKHLESGKETLDGYYADFQRVHGDRVAISAAVQETATQLEEALARAREASETPPAADNGLSEESNPNDTVAPPITSDRGLTDTGLGMLIGGVALGVVGLGAVVMIPVGSTLGQQAEDDFNDAQQELADAVDDTAVNLANTKIQDAEDSGERANAILISGAVLAPLFVGGSVALILLGIRKRNAARSALVRPAPTVTATPAFGRNFGGLSVQGRF